MNIPVQSRQSQCEGYVNIFDTENGCSTLNNIPYFVQRVMRRQEVNYGKDK